MDNQAELIEMLRRNLRDLATDIAMGRAGKIHAIKAWRAATGSTLKDAKDYVDGLSGRATINMEDARIQRVEDRIQLLESRIWKLENVA